MSPSRISRSSLLLIAFFLALCAVTLIRTAWLCDDAYISYRTVDNFVNGYGLTFNPVERVQTFTHPLWMLLHVPAHALTGESYYTGLAVCMSISAFVVLGLLLWSARTSLMPLFAGVALISGKAFTDYSTSGLENPMTHLLIIGFTWIFLTPRARDRSLLMLSALAALAMINRMDTILFFLPALGLSFWERRSWRQFRFVVYGFLPFFIWEAFALFYYGFPFPNTAYAKLGTGFGAEKLIVQGGYYFLNFVRLDPVGAIVVLAGLSLPFVLRDRKLYPLAFGGILYLLYVLKIGGDFMSGRFFTVVFVLALILLINLSHRMNTSIKIGCSVALALLSLIGPSGPPILSDAGYGANRDAVRDAHGIADERAHYYSGTGLLVSRYVTMPTHYWADEGRNWSESGGTVEVRNNLGFYAYFAGPDLHVIDELGLADPLIARLPVPDDANWRPGHFLRRIPAGYPETRRTGITQITNPDLARLYEKLKVITQGSLMSRDRFVEIFRMNRGDYDTWSHGDYEPMP